MTAPFAKGAFGGAASADAEGEYPQSCAMRMTAPFAKGAFWEPRLRTRKDFASAEARRWLSDRPRHPFGSLLISLYHTKHWQVAAALSAAVTTAPKQENAPTMHGCASPQEKSSLFPAALRERGSGGEALLSEKRPLPQSLRLLPSHLRPGVGADALALGAGEIAEAGV